jgi:hypothetical protein
MWAHSSLAMPRSFPRADRAEEVVQAGPQDCFAS